MSLQSWQDFAAWLRNLKLPNIDIDHDYLNDTITVRNRDTMKNLEMRKIRNEGEIIPSFRDIFKKR